MEEKGVIALFAVIFAALVVLFLRLGAYPLLDPDEARFARTSLEMMRSHDYIVPTFEGRMISFTGASVLVLIAVGFAIGGIIGAILALPLASIIRDLFRLFFDKAVAEDLVLEPRPAPALETSRAPSVEPSAIPGGEAVRATG